MKKIILLAMMITTTSYAAIYVNQTKSGGVEYSDTPGNNASIVTAPPLNTVSTKTTTAPSTPTNPTSNSAATPSSSVAIAAAVPSVSGAQTYTSFSIVSPKEGETIQNQNTIPVEMKIEPTMVAGDKIQLYLDGKAVGTPTSTVYQELGIVDRGTHSLYAEIINTSQQAIKKSNAVTIFVHRNSIITSPARPNAINK